MTLIIGIKCKDGIVMGADGAATLGVMGQRTILQPVKKISTIKDKILFAVSGPVGLSQMFRGEIQKLWEDKHFSDKKPFEAMSIIRKSLWEYARYEMEVASSARKAIGNAALQDALCHTLIALPVSSKLCLFQFDQQCGPEEATEDLPFVSAGSGQTIADPFLAFLRRILWSNKTPNLESGIFVTLWTLYHTILINPGGVAKPIQIVVIESKDRDYKIRELSKEELQEHYEAIEAAEKSLLNFRNSMRDTADIKETPKLPTTKE